MSENKGAVWVLGCQVLSGLEHNEAGAGSASFETQVGFSTSLCVSAACRHANRRPMLHIPRLHLDTTTPDRPLLASRVGLSCCQLLDILPKVQKKSHRDLLVPTAAYLYGYTITRPFLCFKYRGCQLGVPALRTPSVQHNHSTKLDCLPALRPSTAQCGPPRVLQRD